MLFLQYRNTTRTFTAKVHTDYNASAKLLFAIKKPDLQAEDDATDANAPLKKTYSASTDAVDNGDGTMTFTCSISPDDIATVTPGTYVAEVCYVDAAGNKTPYERFDYQLEQIINQRAA